MPLLQNHLAVITGAASGIGRGIAQAYAREGARVVLLDVNEQAAAEAAQEIRNGGGEADSFALDVTNREDCFRVAKQVADKAGQVSILVNNAGITRRNGFTSDADTVLKDWHDVLGINLHGPFNVTQAFLEPLRATKGRIINIGSIQSFLHLRTPTSPAYTTSKHGVLGFTRALAVELGRHGIRVNAIGPGFIETPLNEKVRASNPELVKTFMDHTPLGRSGTPADIAGPAVFLASDLSAYVTGTILMADGGYRSV
ncbi:MAG: SDR family oxidoreductase [Bradyrhizobium sp.]|uniref:SDR family NAD(P)-dependent oxidoreductase n=1 Tax=Bradyrhizobium sp. TaxID=376 RepID=UPI001D6CA6F0|nr:SDR family oxidoreductase [Bradyrhizobium sp.]MBV9565785.1 SDR family oxidoreductase [Bradyrhizobium sp.]